MPIFLYIHVVKILRKTDEDDCTARRRAMRAKKKKKKKNCLHPGSNWRPQDFRNIPSVDRRVM
jgi:hypothetical protein